MNLLLKFLPGLKNPWFMLATATVALSLFSSGVYVGKRWEDGKQARAELAIERAEVERLRNAIAHDKVVHQSVLQDLAAEKAARERDALNFKEKLRNVPRETLTVVEWRTPPCPAGNPASGGAAGGQPVEPVVHEAPVVRLSAGACRLWNDALRSALTVAERAERPFAEDACPGPAEVEDAFANLGSVAVLLGECRAREQRTHEWFREAGLTP